jgi:hypothetical protein
MTRPIRFFNSISKNLNNNTFEPESMEKISSELTLLHNQFVAAKEKHDKDAHQTLLGDVKVPAANDRKLSELFVMDKEIKSGKPRLTWNPDGNGLSWSKNESGIVNAITKAFGTQAYAVLQHGRHERLFDKSMVVSHGVATIFDSSLNRWNRYGYSNGRYTIENGPATWLPLHVEIDRLLLALIGNQQYSVVFFNDFNYQRLQANLLSNMNTLVSDVEVQLANQAEVSTTYRAVQRIVNTQKNSESEEPVSPTALMVSGVDILKSDKPVAVTIKMKFAATVIEPTINPKDPDDVTYLSSVLGSELTEYVKLS